MYLSLCTYDGAKDVEISPWFFCGVTMHNPGWWTWCKYQAYRRTTFGELVVSVRMIAHWSRTPLCSPRWREVVPLAGQGLLGPLVVAVLQQDRVRQGTPFTTSSPHSLSPWALTPSWAFQAGLPSTVVILETLLRWGTNLLRAGWPCASCVSCTGHNSKFPVSKSQHRPGSLGTGVLLKVLSFIWRMSFGLVWSAFFFSSSSLSSDLPCTYEIRDNLLCGTRTAVWS